MSTVRKAQRRPPELDPTARPPHNTAKSSARKNSGDAPRGQWPTSRRTRGPARVEVYVQKRDAELNPSTHRPRLGHSTSISLPTRSPVLPGRQRQEKAVVQHQVLSSDAESFNTSDILKVRERLGTLAEEVPSSIKSVHAPQGDKENVKPTSSSPTAKILRIAHEAIAKNHEEPVARPLRNMDQLQRYNGGTGGAHISYTPDKARHRPDHAYSLNLSNNGSTYNPTHTYATTQGQDRYYQERQDAETVSAAGFDPEDEEMLDGHLTFEPTLDYYADTMPNHVPAPAYTFAPRDVPSDLHSLSFRFDRPSTRARGVPRSRGDLSTTNRDTSSHVMAAEQVLMKEDEHAGDRGFDDGLEGFWRPNRLY